MFDSLFQRGFFSFRLILVITLSVYKLVNGYHDVKQNHNEDKYCVTEACIETANSLFKVRIFSKVTLINNRVLLILPTTIQFLTLFLYLI